MERGWVRAAEGLGIHSISTKAEVSISKHSLCPTALALKKGVYFLAKPLEHECEE